MRFSFFYILILLFQLPFFNLYAQVRLEIRDSITKKPLPYVGIWTSDFKKSISTDKFGTAYLNDSLFVNIFTNGYNLKKIENINEKVIFLSKKELLTNNKQIKQKEKKFVLFDNFKKNTNKNLFLSKNKNFTTLEVFLISCPRCKDKKGYLKDIQLSLMNMSEKESVFKLRFFEVNDNLSIGEEITTSEDIVIVCQSSIVNDLNSLNVKSKNSALNTKIDLDKYNISLSDNGIFIGFEMISIPDNKFILTGRLNSYELLIPTIYFEENDGINFFFKNGQWVKGDNDNPIPIMKIRAVLTN